MPADSAPVAIDASAAPPRARPSWYPAPFAKAMEGRTKRPLGDLFGLSNFGVNIVHLAPGARSALRHAHTRQDEFVYVVAGEPTLVTDAGDTLLKPGMCVGFKAGTAMRTISSTARRATSSISKWATAAPATRSTIPTTTSG
jgi:uncharacterized cupin superfamily protein